MHDDNHDHPGPLTGDQRGELLTELSDIARQLDDLPDDAYGVRIDLHDRRREIREELRDRGTHVASDQADEELDEPVRLLDDPVRLVEVTEEELDWLDA